MSSIQTGIQLNDQFTTVIYSIINSVNMAVGAMQDMQQTMNTNVDAAAFDDIRDEINQATMAMDELNAAMSDMEAPSDLTNEMAQTGDEIEQNTRDQQQFNNVVQDGVSNANELSNTISKIGTAIGSMFAIQKVVGFIDDCTDATNTQLNAQRQLASTLSNMGGDQSAYDALVEKAQSIQQAGMYGDEAMIGAAAEFATYMNDTSAIEMMMDTLTNYAAGMSGGGAIDYESMVDYATNLGKITTGAYDAMTKKGFEFTDAQKAVIDGTATESQYVETLGDDWQSMSEDMRSATVIADIINESWADLYSTMSDTPEAELQSIKNSFGDIQEEVGSKLYNSLGNLYGIIADNMPMISSVMMGAADGLNIIITIIGDLIQGIANVAGFVQDNWSVIEPIVWGIVGALAAYVAISTIVNVVNGIMAASAAVHAAAQMMEAGATFAATVAQYGLNAALAACPITWIVLAVIALIAVIFAVCQAIANATGVATSAFGIICGAVATMAAFVVNIIIGLVNTVITIGVELYNMIANFAAGLSILFNDPIAAIEVMFLSLFNFIVGIVKAAAGMLDAVFGSNLADAVAGFQDKVQTQINTTVESAGGSSANTLNASDYTLDRVNYGDAFSAGAAWGDGISDAVSSFSLTDALGIGNSDVLDMSAYSGLANALDSSGLADSAGTTANNTGAMADSLSVTEDELKYLRDIAEQEAVNRFTTAEIKIEQTNHNNISSSMDLDGVVDGLTDAVSEAIDNMTEGVHS
jgi:hypothetical protein